MANNSAVIGLLRVLLSANTAEFETAMKKAQDEVKAWTKELKSVGRQASEVGAALTKTLTVPIVGVSVAAAKVAIDFESSFAGVKKTVNATEPELAALADGFRNLSKTIPINVNELNKIGEAAGALGIRKEDILEFSSVMAQLGVTTNLTSDQAATSIAQIQNIFNAAGKDTKNFASALVALGNDGASTESQIVDFASRLAGAGHQIGLSQQSVLGFSAALANMGLNAELGGTALSKVMSKMSVAVDTGGEKLKAFAESAGMSSAAFRDLFKSDPTEAILRFTEGLGKSSESGKNLTIILNDLGLKGSNVQDVMKRLAGGAGQMRHAVDLAATSWRDNTALTKEAQERFKTTESQLILLGNRVRDVGIALGNALGPAIGLVIDGLNALLPVLDGIVRAFGALPAPVQLAIVGFAGIVAAAGPAIYIFGQLALGTAALTGAFTAQGLASKLLFADLGFIGTALRANVVAAAATVTSYGAMGSASIALTGATRALSVVIMAMPWAAATAGAAALAGGLVYLYSRSKDAAVAAETQGAKQDAINKAIAQGAAATINYAEAVEFNTKKEEERIAAFNRAHRGANSLTEAQQQLTAANEKYAKELTGIKDALTFQIKHMSETGKSVSDLAKEFGISEQTVTRLASSLQAGTRAQKDHTAAVSEAVAISPAAQHAIELLELAHRHQTAALEMETAAWEKWQQTVSRALASIPTNPVLLQGRNLSGLVPLPNAGGAGNLAGVDTSTSGPGFFGSIFGSSAQLGDALASTIMSAVRGGGNPVSAAAGMVGSKIGSGIADFVKKDGTKLFTGALGGIFSATLPVVGSLIGPLASAIWGKLFGSAGRDAVKDFAASKGGFDALQKEMLTLGDDYDRLWKKLTQQTGKNDKAAAAAVIDEITAALARQKEKTDDVTAATAKAAAAAAATATVQQEALEAINQKYDTVIGKLKGDLDSFSGRLQAEADAPEFDELGNRIYGVQELLDMQRQADLEQQIKNAEDARDAEIEAKKETFAALLEDGQQAHKDLQDLFTREPLEVVWRFRQEGGALPPGGPYITPGALTAGMDSGLANSNRAVSAGASLTRGDTGMMNIQVRMDGRNVAAAAVPFIPGKLAVIGVGSGR